MVDDGYRLWVNGEPFQTVRSGNLPPSNSSPLVIASQAAHGPGVCGAIARLEARSATRCRRGTVGRQDRRTELPVRADHPGAKAHQHRRIFLGLPARTVSLDDQPGRPGSDQTPAGEWFLGKQAVADLAVRRHPSGRADAGCGPGNQRNAAGTVDDFNCDKLS